MYIYEDIKKMTNLFMSIACTILRFSSETKHESVRTIYSNQNVIYLKMHINI